MKKLFVLAVAVAMVAAFAMPAAADEADWSFYGSARISTWYTGTDIGDLDTDNFDLDLQGNSRIGANVKSGAVSGRFEYGTGVNVRILWGEWDFGGGAFGVGQHYTPMNMFYSNQVYGGDADLLNVGGIYNGRRPMLRLKMGGLQVALLQAHAISDLGTGSEEHPLPKIEAAYSFNAGPAALKLAVGGLTYTVDPDGIDEDVAAYVAGLGGKFNLGAVTLAANAWYGQNVGQYGLWHNTLDDAVVVGDSIEDTESIGLIGVATFKASDMVAIEGGVGYTASDNDTYATEDDEMVYYGQAVFTLAPGVFIIPEIGYYDLGDGPAGGDQGDTTYAGAKFQINF